MSEQCGSHQELMLSVARIEGKLNNVDEKLELFQEHVKESVQVRDDVRDNKRFTCNISRVIWLVIAAVVGVAIKAFGR